MELCPRQRKIIQMQECNPNPMVVLPSSEENSKNPLEKIILKFHSLGNLLFRETWPALKEKEKKPTFQ